MVYDSTATDPCFVDGRPPDAIHQLLAWVRSRLARRPPWRLISARRKLGRILFEVEEDTPLGPQRLIGKFGDSGRAATLFHTLQCLRAAGFAPPARYTVPEPVVFIPDRGFVLQEKVPGQQAAGLLVNDEDHDHSGALHSADWLAALTHCDLRAEVSQPARHLVWTWANDLVAVYPSGSATIRALLPVICRRLDEPISSVLPSHGDFHPSNIFIAGDRVTAIDLDKFALREPETDAGWFLMQTAAFGFFAERTFERTARARRTFFEHYAAEARRPLRVERVGLYMAMAFLRNLHFELVLLKTGRTEFADPWLWAAAAAIDGNLHLEP